MKKSCLITLILLCLFLNFYRVQAQTNQPNLNQQELMQQFIGTWQANLNKDTVEVWDYQQYGKAIIANVYFVVKGRKIPQVVINLGFNQKENEFKIYTLGQDGGYQTLIGVFLSNNKFVASCVQDYNSNVLFYRNEHTFINANERTLIRYNKDGAKLSERQFTKVK